MFGLKVGVRSACLDSPQGNPLDGSSKLVFGELLHDLHFFGASMLKFI